MGGLAKVIGTSSIAMAAAFLVATSVRAQTPTQGERLFLEGRALLEKGQPKVVVRRSRHAPTGGRSRSRPA